MKLLCAIAFWAGCSATFAQGTFQNLDFEDANPISTFPGTVTASSAIPDWTAELAGVSETQILENTGTTGAAAVILLAQGYSQPPLEGDYSVLLTGSFLGSASISQTGLIPAGTEFLYFDTYVGPGSGSLALFIGNQSIPFESIAGGGPYTRYSADISAWSGQTEQLTFSALQDTTGLNNWEIDTISFSPGTVPEPDALALMSVGGLVFGIYRRVQSRRK